MTPVSQAMADVILRRSLPGLFVLTGGLFCALVFWAAFQPEYQMVGVVLATRPAAGDRDHRISRRSAMNIVFTTNSNVAFFLPIEFLFWGFVAAYVLHILEESLLGDIFVEKVQKHYWPNYTWRHFFGFNTLLLTLEVTAILVYDILGGNWIIFPLVLFSERFLNGFWHLGETILTRRFSSGLLSSVLFWILGYFVIRYAVLPGEITLTQLMVGFLGGAVITGAMLGFMQFGRLPGAAALRKTA